jgi:hypothetical protein
MAEIFEKSNSAVAGLSLITPDDRMEVKEERRHRKKPLKGGNRPGGAEQINNSGSDPSLNNRSSKGLTALPGSPYGSPRIGVPVNVPVPLSPASSSGNLTFGMSSRNSSYSDLSTASTTGPSKRACMFYSSGACRNGDQCRSCCNLLLLTAALLLLYLLLLPFLTAVAAVTAASSNCHY